VTRNRAPFRLCDVLGLAAAGLALAGHAAPAAALSEPALRAYAAGFVYDTSVGAVGPFQDQAGATGPLTADVEAGAVLAYRYPGHFPDYELEATLFAAAESRVDYGTNSAALELNLRATSGDDRGAFPAGNFSGSLPYNSTLEPHATAESSWRDTFVIEGGTGMGMATVRVALSGNAASRYGANGTIWYDAEPSFETFGTSGYGFAQYALDIRYEELPPGLDPEYSDPIRWEESYSAPLPQFIDQIGAPELLEGSFVFEYGVPFELQSSLNLSGYDQIAIDFSHTAILSGFELPVGATLTSGSGHLYPVPEPSTAALVGSALLFVAGWARRGR